MSGAARIERAIRRASAGGGLAFIPFVTAGDPDLAATARFAAALARGGAAVLELGIPYGDPLADGPVIQRSSERALASGTTLDRVLDSLPEIREAAGVPLVLFGYANPVLRFGPARFAARAAEAGADGLLLTDLPPEEAEPVASPCRERGLATVFLAAPTSTPARLAILAGASTGFVYAVSRTGVTGEGAAPDAGVRALTARLREVTDLPIAVGFGISDPSQVSGLRGAAEAFVVGSALVRLVAEHAGGPAAAQALEALAVRLVAAAAPSGS